MGVLCATSENSALLKKEKRKQSTAVKLQAVPTNVGLPKNKGQRQNIKSLPTNVGRHYCANTYKKTVVGIEFVVVIPNTHDLNEIHGQSVSYHKITATHSLVDTGYTRLLQYLRPLSLLPSVG